MQPVAERGGSDHALLRLCRQLVADGWQPHIVFPAEPPLSAEFAAAGATLHQVPMRRVTRSGGAGYWLSYTAAWPISVLRIWALGRRLRPDVVHSNSLHCWYAWPAAALLRVPHIWHAREIVVQSRLALGLERQLTKHFAWRIVAVSSAVARQFEGGKVVVAHDTLGPEDGFSPARAGNFRARVGISDQAVLVGAAGRLDTWKGFDVLLEAFPRIRRERPDVELVIAGGPVPGKEHYAAELEAKAGATEGAHWLGEREDMAELMADLDLFVLPSTEPEPFASSALEALASGAPLAATAHGGSPEMLSGTPQGTGLLFPPRDAGALAQAVLELLPREASSAAGRRERRAVLVGDPRKLLALFNEAFELGASRTPRRRPGEQAGQVPEAGRQVR